jgi:hypothetical protein
MTADPQNHELEQMIRLLSNRPALEDLGADAAWIERCWRLVGEYRALQRKVEELEAKLSSLEGGSSQDTSIL